MADMREDDCKFKNRRYICLLRDVLNDRIARSGGGTEAAFKTE